MECLEPHDNQRYGINLGSTPSSDSLSGAGKDRRAEFIPKSDSADRRPPLPFASIGVHSRLDFSEHPMCGF